MISEKLLCLILFQFALLKEYHFSNSTAGVSVPIQTLNKTFYVNSGGLSTESDMNITEVSSPTHLRNISLNDTLNVSSTRANSTELEIIQIFDGNSTTGTTPPTLNPTVTPPTLNSTVTPPTPNSTLTPPTLNSTVITGRFNMTSVNVTCNDQLCNDTFESNFTVAAGAIGSSEDSSAFRLQNSAAIAAGAFLVSAVIGYLSCVGYRRYLQRKYGNGQILIAEEAYDTTDLRYFEI